MRSIVYILLAAVLLIAIPGYTQNNNDSSLVRSVKYIQMKLGLSDNVADQLLTAMTNMRHEMQMTGANSNAEDRKTQMRRIKANYNAQVKNLLTLQQWVSYQQLEAASSEGFKKRMKAKKIAVSELE